MPLKHKMWITEEVNYIITPIEHDVFLNLNDIRERDLFIDAFWRHRDPTPGTPDNEFRDEHYRRLDHANRRFRGTGRPGWKTDRGKIYIILGEPKDNRIFFGTDAHYPAEQWYYQGIPGSGLPQGFSVLFFQRGRVGDWILYDPAQDGPWSLMSNYRGNPGDYIESYYDLREIEPELAQLSISLIPGEAIMNVPSMTSSILLRNIDVAAIKNIEDRYAAKFMEYKDIVEVEYSANYISSDAQIQIIQDRSGNYFVHYSIQPLNLSMGRIDSTIYTSLDFNGIITDEQGIPIHQFENRIPLKFTSAQFDQMKQRPFLFSDKFPLVPGEYKFSLIMKNSVSKEFTSFNGTLSIPSSISSLQMSPLLLGFNVAKPSSQKDLNKPFVVDDVQIYSQSSNSFLNTDNLHVFFQIAGSTENVKKSLSINYRIYKEDEEYFTVTYPIGKYEDTLNVIEMIPLKEFIPGYFRITIALLDESENEVTSQSENFIITTAPSLPRPWVIGNSQDDSGAAHVEYILGRQFSQKQDYVSAREWLEKAYHQDPNNLSYGLHLAQALFDLESYQDAINLLAPFKEMGRDSFDYTLLLGSSYQSLGKYAEAIKVFDEALSQFGLSVMLLNPLGECYYRLGDGEEALAAFEKSLEIDPSQEEIKERVAFLKK